MSRKILAIDDSITLRQFILRSLSQHSAEYEIHLAKDGAEGVALTSQIKPDLILLDFILPDMKGDEVCRKLQENPDVAQIPVVLMSSSAPEIKKVEEEFSNVVRSIAKPFTAELLCATVGYVLREAAQQTAANKQLAVARTASGASKKSAAPGNILFCGLTSYFPISDALLGIQEDRLTGVLRVHLKEAAVEVYCDQGHILMVTTRSAQLYMQDSAYRFTPEQEALREIAARGQSDCSCPLFIVLVSRNVLSNEAMHELCHEHGLRLFSRIWTESRLRFEFEELTTLPEFTKYVPPYTDGMLDWCFESLRLVGDDCLSALAWGEATGIAAFTRAGYERIQVIPLNEEEMAFVGYASRGSTLQQIAEAMHVPVEMAQKILFRFLALDIFNYWPAAALGRA